MKPIMVLYTINGKSFSRFLDNDEYAFNLSLNLFWRYDATVEIYARFPDEFGGQYVFQRGFTEYLESLRKVLAEKKAEREAERKKAKQGRTCKKAEG